MNNFIEIPASKQSIGKRSLIFGVGINNADYIVQPYDEDGKRLICPYYLKWSNLLRRCYCPKDQEKHPTYIDCYVCAEWLYFTKFKAWMEKQDWKNKELDKDIKFVANKQYTGDSCLFITKSLNVLLTDHGNARGEYPQGVHFNKHAAKFIAQLNLNGKKKYLGVFAKATEARKAYIVAKNIEIIRQSNLPENKEIKDYIMQHLMDEVVA